MGLPRTVSEINGDFGQKSQIFPTPVYFAPSLKGIPLELGIGAVKNYNDDATGPRKKFDDMFNGVDTIHQRDGRTDRQTPDDSIASRGKTIF